MIRVYAAKIDNIDIDKVDLGSFNLPRCQIERIEKMKSPKAKRQSFCAALLLKYALNEAGIFEYDILTGPHGKPYLKDGQCEFNISHTDGRVMCVIADSEVGCDVQEVTDISLGVADRFFSGSERTIVNGAGDKRDMFFRLWSLRESFIKATGYGMALCQGKFSVGIEDDVATVKQSINDMNYFFREYKFNDNYKYAVCSTTNDFADMEWVDLGEVWKKGLM